MINLFGSARRADVARIDRFHWSAWITSVLVSHASRARFLCSEDLIIVALFLWLGSLRVATASHSGGRPAGDVCRQARGIRAQAFPRSIVAERGRPNQKTADAGRNGLSGPCARRLRRVKAGER
jgi:hypothetical protein